MDGQDLLERLRGDRETELSRLGSSKGLYALTGGEMDGDRIRAAAATDADAAVRTFDAWADEASGEPADAFAAAAGTARDHAEALGVDPLADAPAVYDVLAGLDATPERAGGLLGRAVVSRLVYDQMVGFFVGDADPQSADAFRDLRDDVADQREAAAALLGDVCDDDADWTAAADAADAVVAAAYDEYVTRLESMGVKPKNIC